MPIEHVNLQPFKIQDGATDYPDKHDAAMDGQQNKINEMVDATNAAVDEVSQNIESINVVAENISVIQEAPVAASTASSSALRAESAAVLRADRPYPMLVKLSSNPVFMQSDSGSGSVLWPYLVNLTQGGEEGVALFWSTDHDSNPDTAGIFLATAPSPEGPWTLRGRVFTDVEGGGGQCETPSVVWDEIGQEWLMYYQLDHVPGSIGTQVTMLATAPYIIDENGDPGEWMPQGIMLDARNAMEPGDGHCGYFKPWQFAGRWYGHSLYGGTNAARFALWTSSDARSWRADPRRIGFQGPLLDRVTGYEPGYRIRPHSGFVIPRAGQLWWVGPCSGASAGGNTQPNRLVSVPLSLDGRIFGPPAEITPALQEWEDADYGVTQVGSPVVWEGRVFVPYRAGSADGGFGMAEVI